MRRTIADTSKPSIASEAVPIRVIKIAAVSFADAPLANAIQLTVARHEKTKTSSDVVATAAHRLQPIPRDISQPQSIESAPNVPPDIKANGVHI